MPIAQLLKKVERTDRFAGSILLTSLNLNQLSLSKELANNVKELLSAAISNIEKGKPVYAGLMGTSGEEEILFV